MKRYTYIILVLTNLILLSCGKSESNSTKEVEAHDDSIIEISQEQFEKSGLQLGLPKEAKFSEQFPEAKTVPQITWYERHLGGYFEFAKEVEETRNYGDGQV